jgi:hypothetical protein
MQTVLYGDINYGDYFCKECYDKHSCFHCKNMNLQIVFGAPLHSENNIVQSEQHTALEFSKHTDYIPKTISYVNYLPLFGHNFKLFCESCYKNEDVYCSDDDDDLSVNNNDDNESHDSEFEYDIDDEEEVNTHYDMYYVRRGKYDIY